MNAIGDFPGSLRKAISVDIKGDGSAILDDNTVGQLQLCDASVSDTYCINKNNINKIKLCTGTNISCNDITYNTKGTYVFYFDSNDKLTSEAKSAKKAYECQFSGDASPYTLTECRVIDEETTIIKDRGILNCDVITGCKLTAPTEQENIIYDRMTFNNCLEENTVCKTEYEDSTSGYLYTCRYSSVGASTECSLIVNVGYYIKNKNLYTCTNRDNVKCTKSIKTNENEISTCNGSNNGAVVYNKNKFVICTGSGTSKDLTDEVIEYIIYKNNAINTYGLTTNQYGIINASKLSVLFNLEVKGKKKTYIILHNIII